MYQDGEYDLAGFAVGSVDEGRLIDGKGVQAGDVVLGLASSGVHSNGFSLVRKILQARCLLCPGRCCPGRCCPGRCCPRAAGTARDHLPLVSVALVPVCWLSQYRNRMNPACTGSGAHIRQWLRGAHGTMADLEARGLGLQVSGTALSDRVPWDGATFGEVLLEPTVIYVRRILKLLSRTDNVRVPPPPPPPGPTHTHAAEGA